MEKKGCDEIEHEVTIGERRMKYVKECIEDIQKSLNLMEEELEGEIDDYNSVLREVQEAMKEKQDNEKIEKDLINKKRDLERRIRHTGKI